MKAVVKYGRQPGQVELRDVPVPEPGPGQVLVRVAACGICGSDLHAYLSDPGYEFVAVPVVLGHEFSGTVEAVGQGVSDLAPGDRVVGLAIQGCGRCETCRSGSSHLCPSRRVHGLHHDGGMAEYTTVGQEHLVRVPDGVDLPAVALVEPLSVAVHAVVDRSRVRPGDLVVVSGPGPIGLLCALVARHAGGTVVVTGAQADATHRLPAAARLGFPVLNVAEEPLSDGLRRLTGRSEADVWVEASGAGAALEAAAGSVRSGGVVTVVGMYAHPVELFFTSLVRKEVDVLFSYASHRANYLRALALVAGGAIDPTPLADPFPLSRASEAFAAALEKRVVKPVLLP
ncbi:zinc-binding dehydrogenase [Caldinitratiruptor microaerophilus]|uniref:Alcohol dehydrogenase n=1 Tax=Caldinitratiruptor microaerophilus TaxID=671077 RepID=A0AA35CKH0_9FIRM|nr:zinc-binding dehydrogenase [Caldinitratiruptor microaerophilus]BDG60174.1 alcohol dehydrogenase [Caldinitratiruptor microaerophilus]